MRIAVKLAFDEHAAVRLLNWLAKENAVLLRAQPDLPLLYDAGVTYQRETDETWCDFLNMLAQGHEDCDGLAAARAGELLARGWRALRPGDAGFATAERARPSSVQAEVMLTTRSTPDDPGLYHCIVRYRVGSRWYRDDPSARLGMLGGRIDPLVQQRWAARTGARALQDYTPRRDTPRTGARQRRPRERRERPAKVRRTRPPQAPEPTLEPLWSEPSWDAPDASWGAAPREVWGPSARLGRRLRIQAACGHRAAVIELRPGLYLVAELPETVAEAEFGFAPLLAPLLLTAAKRALAEHAIAAHEAVVEADPTRAIATVEAFVLALQASRAALDRIAAKLPLVAPDAAFNSHIRAMEQRYVDLAAGLFAEARPTSLVPPPRHAVGCPLPSPLSPREALAHLLRSPDFQRFESELARVSAFHVLGIERRELSHAALLGWLLNPRGHHGLGTIPLRSFLMLACGLGDGDTPGPDAVEIDGLDLHSAQVDLEVVARAPGSGRTRRLDVVVAVPHGETTRAVLIVEYKVDASETEDQTVDYALWAQVEAEKHGWSTEPLLVYLCPGRGQPASDRFVVVDYDAYLPWLDELLTHRPSSTAEFLLQEFRACLGQRADVQDERQDELRNAVVASEGAAIEALRTVPSSIPEVQAVVLRHKDALNALGLFRSRQSKGYSAFVAAFRDALRDVLDPEIWHIGGGEGSLIAIYLPAVSILREVTGDERGFSSALRLHLFMERPRRERARAVIEVIGNHPHLDTVESRGLRERLAGDLRTRFGSRFDQPARGQIVGAFVLAAPGLVHVEDDTSRRVEGLGDELRRKAMAVRDVGEALQAWMPVFRSALEDVPG